MAETETERMGAVVAFVSQKGGVGKSTLARGLAREAAKAGLKVKIGDLDTQQGTCVYWQLDRQKANIQPSVEVQSFETAKAALLQAPLYDLFIIDGPARASEATKFIADKANLVILATGPGKDDLRPAVAVFDALSKEGISKQKLAFAINKVLTPAEARDARAYLIEAGYSVIDGFLEAMPSYRSAHDEGRSITETRYPTLNGKADEVIQSIIDRIPHG